MSITSEPAVDRLRGMVNGFRATQVCYVFAKLALADRLVNSSLTAIEVAISVDADPDTLHRVLRLAALLGLVLEEPSGRFRLAPLGELLRTDSPDSIRPVAIQLGELHYAAWGALLHATKTGQSAFEHVFGAPLFDYLAKNPEAQATFDAYMSANKDPFADALPEKYDFSRFRVIVDVGAGNGSVSAAVLARNRDLKAIIFDRPQVMKAATELLGSAALAGRCRLIAGDFFESVPSGGDIYLLSNVIHDWGDADALRILRNCRAAMDQSTPLIVLEAVLPRHGQTDGTVMSDVNMLVMLTGRERTQDEYASLLHTAGLHVSKTTSISGRLSLIEAFPD